MTAASAAVLPSGTNLEVRLSAATGSRVSHPGDRIEATIIAPVFADDRLIIPQGATISGVVQSVDRLGLGLKHRTATVKYRFNSLQLIDGRAFPIEARVAEVETAKERTSSDGIVGGISPAANLSSGVSFAISALFLDPGIAMPVLGIKFLIARSPDPEIYFPAGTEMLLEVLADTELPTPSAVSSDVSSLTPEQVANIRQLLTRLPRQQTNQSRNSPSDLVNVLLLGNHDQIERAFSAAGWTGEQRHSVLALYRMYHCTVQRIGYRMAPMGTLMLNGKAPDSAYQKSLDTFSKRHHIRIWKQRDSDVWLGAATQDVAYMVRGMRMTHATDRVIDNERAKIVNDLWFTGCVDAGSLISRDSLTPADENGNSIVTDRRIAALQLNDCQNPRSMPPASSSPGPRPRRRIVQALAAVGNDIARSNPVSLGYSVARSFLDDSGARSRQLAPQTTSRPQKGDSSAALARREWRRGSVLDPSQEISSPRESARSGVPGSL